MAVFFCSVCLGVWSLWQKLSGQALEGFTTVILLELLIGSILMICLGIIGYYVARIYEEIKDRPRYIVAETCKGDKEGPGKKGE
jgi:dolichol-phosphate mannosyltransferase